MRLTWVIPVLLAVLPACSADGSGSGHGSAGPTLPQPAVSSPRPCSDQTEHPFVVVMRDDRFTPPCLVVSGGIPFRIRNRGSHRHNLTIQGTGFSVDVPPGGILSRPALLRAHVPPGTYHFFCRFHRSRGMTGELHVLAA